MLQCTASESVALQLCSPSGQLIAEESTAGHVESPRPSAAFMCLQAECNHPRYFPAIASLPPPHLPPCVGDLTEVTTAAAGVDKLCPPAVPPPALGAVTTSDIAAGRQLPQPPSVNPPPPSLPESLPLPPWLCHLSTRLIFGSCC